jgi:tetratricopeptide (TPR) repeat protein
MLYRRLTQDGFDPWLDEVNLAPGQAWRETIEDAVRASEAVVVCLSHGSVNKEGFLQKEIKLAIDVADEKPEGTIFVIPLRLEDVAVPRRLRELQWANLYEDGGYERLVAALRDRAERLGRTVGSHIGPKSEVWPNSGPPLPPTPPPQTNWMLWIGSHLVHVLALMSMILIAAVAIGFTLYKSHEQYRAQGQQLNMAGVEKLHSFDTGEAESLLRQAVTADPNNAIAHANLAIALGERGNYTAAQSEAQRAFSLRRGLGDRDRLLVEGARSEMNWQLGSAARSYADAWKKYGDVDAGLRLARVQTISGKGSAALDTLHEMRATLIVSATSRIDYETALAADALRNFDTEVEILRRIGQDHQNQPLILAAALSQECWSLFQNGKLKEAEQPCGRAISIFADQGEKLGRARALTRQSLLLSRGDKKDQQKALDLQGEAVDIVQSLGAELDEAGARQNRANLLINFGRYDAARSDYEAAGKLYDRIGFKEGSAALENNWATTLLDSCHYEEAKDRFESARKAYESAENQSGLAIASSNVGVALYFLGDLVGAEKYLREALRIADNSNMALDRGEWLTQLGNIFVAQNKMPLAELCFRGQKCYADGTPSATTSGEPPVLIEAKIEYASMLIEIKRASAAERNARVQASGANGKDPEEEALALDVLARALIQQGGGKKLAEASKAIAEAQSLGIQSCTTGLSLAITAARVSAHQGDFLLARTQVNNALRRSEDLKLLGYRLQAVLVQAETEFLAGDLNAARRHLESLNELAGPSGFALVQNKGQGLMVSVKLGSPRQKAKSSG